MYPARMPVVRLSELLGRPGPAAFLRGVVAGGRYANAYLLVGPAGVGKGTAALAFARALLCDARGGTKEQGGLFEAPDPPSAGTRATAAPGPPDDACGACPSCLKAAQLQHPDLRFLFPVSGEEKELETTVAETLQSLRDDPLYVFSYEKAASIRLSMTRELLRELGYRPFEAARRVVVVRDADRMREDQYSAMLKSLEEPGASTVWVLTTARPARLPATILSRCQRVRFGPLPEEVVAGFLRERAGVPAKTAELLAALSSGSLTRALVLRDGDPADERDAALQLLGPAARGEAAELWRAVQGFTKFGRAGREVLRRMIEFQELWLRDLLRARYGGAEVPLVNADRAGVIRKEAAGIEAAEVRRRLMVLEEVLRAVEGNVTPELALFSGLSRLTRQRFKGAAWPPHPTPRWDY